MGVTLIRQPLEDFINFLGIVVDDSSFPLLPVVINSLFESVKIREKQRCYFKRGLYYEVDEAHLRRGDIRRAPIHEHRYT